MEPYHNTGSYHEEANDSQHYYRSKASDQTSLTEDNNDRFLTSRPHLSSSTSSNHNRKTNINFLDPAAALTGSPASDNLPPISVYPSTELARSPSYPTSNTHHSPSIPPTKSSLSQNWNLDSLNITTIPQVRVDQSPQYPQLTSPAEDASCRPTPPASVHQADMSAIGVHFDAQFEASNRHNYTWPLSAMNEQYQGQAFNLNTYGTQIPDATYGRTFSSSPQIADFIPEHRVLKRQQDAARRSSKIRARRERSSSNSYNVSQSTTPDMIPREMAPFNATMAPMSLPTEAIMSSLTSNMYIPSTTSSISHTDSPDMYTTAQFPLATNDFSSFLMPFTTSMAETTIASYSPRSQSLSVSSEPQPYFYGQDSQLMTQDPHDSVRVVNTRPKPQCWEHGCNGRQFSTFSNLLRHQREKSGVANKPTCPHCGAEFTRTTARNGHMAHEKCKQRRDS